MFVKFGIAFAWLVCICKRLFCGNYGDNPSIKIFAAETADKTGFFSPPFIYIITLTSSTVIGRVTRLEKKESKMRLLVLFICIEFE